MSRILVVAGEPSGDRAIAAILRALGNPSAFGVGGDGIGESGAELLAHASTTSAMGLAELDVRAIGSALARLIAAILRERPRVAILASWSTANGRIAPLLRRLGTRVVWVSPPEVWAWRPRRAKRLARAADVLIPTLPFEEKLWRDAGANAYFVGHPLLDAPFDRAAMRASLGLGDRAVAVLPGSRRGEIERLLPAFVSATRGLETRLIIAPSLSGELRARLLATGMQVLEAPSDHGAAAMLPGFAAALVASGTASLEAAACGASPVIAYAMHPLTMAIARALIQTPHVALPNVVLGRRAFEEHFGTRIDPSALRASLLATLDDPTRRSACAEVRAALDPEMPGTWAERAAALARA